LFCIPTMFVVCLFIICLPIKYNFVKNQIVMIPIDYTILWQYEPIETWRFIFVFFSSRCTRKVLEIIYVIIWPHDALTVIQSHNFFLQLISDKRCNREFPTIVQYRIKSSNIPILGCNNIITSCPRGENKNITFCNQRTALA